MTGLYLPLSGTRNIRLLSLADNEVHHGRILQCKFEERDLDMILPWDSYNALSYVWGSSPEKIEIMCNGHLAHITTNLYDALAQIWSLTPKKMMWVDALCINQSDAVEKGRQVSMMGDIYEHASTVIIWFGKTDELIIQAWSLIQRARGQGNSTSIPTTVLEHFTRHPWFFRAWTLQEVLLAAKAVALCGPHWIDWRAITKAGLPGIPLEELRECAKLALAQDTYSVPSQLTQLILASRHRVSTDPRDKIYALLGLLSDRHVKISPNYEITPWKVFADVVTSNYEADGDLSLLNACGSGWQHRKPQNTEGQELSDHPSWVVDLANPSAFENIQDRAFWPKITPKGCFAVHDHQSTNGVLRLRGVPLGYLRMASNGKQGSCKLVMIPPCVTGIKEELFDIDFEKESEFLLPKNTNLIPPNNTRSYLKGVRFAPQVVERLRSPDFSSFQKASSMLLTSAIWKRIDAHGKSRCNCQRQHIILTRHRRELPIQDITLVRQYVLPEAQDNDLVCAFSEFDGLFLLRSRPDGDRFGLVGSAFRSAASEKTLRTKLHKSGEGYSGRNVLEDWSQRAYLPGVFSFDIV